MVPNPTAIGMLDECRISFNLSAIRKTRSFLYIACENNALLYKFLGWIRSLPAEKY